MPAPIPWSSLEESCKASWLWKTATEDLRDHLSHLIVVASGDKPKLELAKSLTQAVAAILLACPAAIGVSWGKHGLLVPQKVFIRFATEILPHDFPIQVWIDFRVGRTEDGASFGFTCGMDGFDLMEFEALNAKEPPVELRNRLWSLASYLLENGPVIMDGNTVGRDAREKIRVRYSPSSFGNEQQVMRLVWEYSK